MSDITEMTLDQQTKPGAPTSTQLAVAAQSHKPGLQMETDLLAGKDVVDRFIDQGTNFLIMTNVPIIAYLLTKVPGICKQGAMLSYTEAYAMALTAVIEQANPFIKQLYRTGPYSFATVTQVKINNLRKIGIHLGTPKYTPIERPWPEGKKLFRFNTVTKREETFTLDKEPGILIEITVGGSPVEYAAWYIEHYVSGNPQWYEKIDRMLRVAALREAIRWGGGEGVSDPIGQEDKEDQIEVETPNISVKK